MVSERAERSFPPHDTEVRLVRAYVRELARGWGIDPEPAMLVASELATNAVLHARSCFEVTVSIDGDDVTVEVFDENPRIPTTGEAAPGALSGRGLTLVTSLARHWGVRPCAGGKVVWAQL